MRSVRFLLAIALVSTGVMAFSDDAFAKKDKGTETAGTVTNPFEGIPDIKDSGITDFDPTFTEAAGIQTSLKTTYTNLDGARKDLNTALGVATDAPFKTALEDLKTKAAGKLTIAMEGTTPKLKASDAVPENVQKGLDAVNGLVDKGQAAVTEVVGLVDKVKSLGTTAAAFPAKIPGMLGTLTPELAKTAPAIVKDNVKAIKAMPGQIDAIKGIVTGLLEDIKSVFAG